MVKEEWAASKVFRGSGFMAPKPKKGGEREKEIDR